MKRYKKKNVIYNFYFYTTWSIFIRKGTQILDVIKCFLKDIFIYKISFFADR